MEFNAASPFMAAGAPAVGTEDGAVVLPGTVAGVVTVGEPLLTIDDEELLLLLALGLLALELSLEISTELLLSEDTKALLSEELLPEERFCEELERVDEINEVDEIDEVADETDEEVDDKGELDEIDEVVDEEIGEVEVEEIWETDEVVDTVVEPGMAEIKPVLLEAAAPLVVEPAALVVTAPAADSVKFRIGTGFVALQKSRN